MRILFSLLILFFPCFRLHCNTLQQKLLPRAVYDRFCCSWNSGCKRNLWIFFLGLYLHCSKICCRFVVYDDSCRSWESVQMWFVNVFSTLCVVSHDICTPSLTSHLHTFFTVMILAMLWDEICTPSLTWHLNIFSHITSVHLLYCDDSCNVVRWQLHAFSHMTSVHFPSNQTCTPSVLWLFLPQ